MTSPWPRRFGVLLTCFVAASACKVEKVEAPEPDNEVQADAGSGWIEEGDSAASGAQPEAAEKPRVREEGPDVGSRAEALQAVAAGNPEGAARFLDKHLSSKADDDEARVAHARALVMRGRYDDAAKALDAAPKATVVVERARARLHRLRGEHEKAEAKLRKLSKAHPNELGVRGELLDLWVAMGRRGSKDAIALRESLYDAWDAGKVKTPDEMLAVARATLSRRSRGGFQDAEFALGEAEQVESPQSGTATMDEVLLAHAAVFLKNYRPDEAAVSLVEILKRDEWHADALAGMAEVAVRSLRLGDGAKLAEEALQTNPHHPGAHAILARVALIEGRREEARSRIEEHVLVINPRHAQGLAVLAGLAVAAGDNKGYQKARDRALAHNAQNEEFFTTLADDLSFLHLYPEVAEITDDAIKRMPEDQFVLGAHGLNLMRLPGREMEGLDAIQRAYKKDKWNERTANTVEFYEKNITPEQEPPYVDHAAGKFSLRLPAHDRQLVVDQYMLAANRARKALDKRYGIDPGKLRLEIYETPQDFSLRTVGVPSLGAVGVCFGGVITTLGPYSATHNFDQVVWHELAHVYAIKLSKGRVPRWFTEGLSEWESEVADPSWARESADLLVEAKAAGKLRKLSQLELAFLRAESGLMMEAAYSKAAYAMRYLGDTYGLPKIIQMLKGYGEGKDTDELFVEVLGKDMPTVEREFEAWFDKELQRRVSGWRPDRPNDQKRNAIYVEAMKTARDGKLDEAARLLEQLIAEGGDGHFTRILLARLLLERKQAKAAVKHLEKARSFNLESTEAHLLLVEVARRQKDVKAEKDHLESILEIDAMKFGPAGRLLMLAVVTKDQKRSDYAYERAAAIAPLHPLVLGAGALRHAKKKRKLAEQMLAKSVEQLRQAEGARGDSYVLAALAADTLGQKDVAKEMAERARKDEKLPDAARKRIGKL